VRAPEGIPLDNGNRQTIHEEVDCSNDHRKQSELYKRGPRKELIQQIRTHGKAPHKATPMLQPISGILLLLAQAENATSHSDGQSSGY
jgi:hypothetical protein